ncbi:MAG: chemotaxis protein CheW [Nitrospirae bacterium]|nr:chemotaxis protein CheW [Nitrospirota bacterium]
MKQEKPKKPIDWGEIYRRIEAAKAAIDRTQFSREDRDKILKARAKDLAMEPQREEGEVESIEVVEFMLAYERYGFESKYVREVYPLSEITPVPCTPNYVSGIINVRGVILSVIDIKRFFDLPEKGLTDLNKVIILHSDTMEFGVLADSISGVQGISLSDMETSLPTLTDIRAEYLKGVTKERVVILDAEKLLSDKKLIVHEEV